MRGKKFFLNVLHLLSFMIFGTSTGFAATFYFFDSAPFLDPSLLPDSTPIGIVVIPFIVFVVCASITLLLSVLLFCIKKPVRMSLIIYRKGESKICAVFRSLGYLTVFFLIYSAIRDWISFRQFFLSGLWFYTSHILFAISGTVIFISIIAKKDGV